MSPSLRSLGATALRKIGLSRYRPSPITLSSALTRSRSHHLELNTLIDIGASNGCWAKEARKVYPDIFCFLVEANPSHHDALEEFKKTMQT